MVKAHHHPVKLMGCGFVLTAVSASPQLAWDAIRAGVSEIERIEDLISSWKEDSQTSEINRCAGIRPVKVDNELIGLIQRSLKISELTGGAFDISGGLARFYYNFNQQENPLPSEEKVSELCQLINYRNIEINEDDQTVFLKREGMKIGFGGIGKGYAAYRAHK
jgi:thiamine biosynthesis lipoprotein